MVEKAVNRSFDVQIFGELKPYNDTISAARCRIFYKGINRNATYISEEFSEKLLKTLPYSPIKGIFNAESGDFEDHGSSRDSGKVYGVVPENPEITWETHLDGDGVAREYACCNVLLFTGTYEEANYILGKSQSMELYGPSISGEWKVIDGIEVFEFSEGCFLGLMALGTEVEPCFEGAAFFSLCSDLRNIIRKIEDSGLGKDEGGLTQGGFELMADLINNPAEPAVEPIVEPIAEIVVEPVVEPAAEPEVEPVVEPEVDPEIVPANTDGFSALIDLLVEKGIETYEQLSELFKSAETESLYVALQSEHENLNAEFVSAIAERDTAKTSLEEEIAKNSLLQTEVDELKTFKEKVMTEQKEAIVEKYSTLLPEDKLSEIKENMETYSTLELEKELAFALAQLSPEIFTNSPEYRVSTLPSTQTSGAARLIKKHKN